MEVFDRYHVNDSTGLRGFVILSDANTGKIYVKKHNLILNAGRQIIISKLLTDFVNNTDYSSLPNYKLTKIIISDDASEPYYDDKYEDVNIIKTIDVVPSNNTVKIDMDKLQAKISLSFSITSESTEFRNVLSLNSLGLVFTNTAENASPDPILFSRITFDPVPITNDPKEFKLDYYIYF